MVASLADRTLVALAFTLFSSAAAGCAGSEPTPGVWRYAETSVGQNTCNYDGVISNGGGEFRLIADGDGYRIEPADGTAPFTCTLSGGELDCPERAAVEEEISGLDATLVVEVVAKATVESESEMTGTQEGKVSCIGSGCATAAAAVGASLPCEFSVDFRAELVEAE